MLTDSVHHISFAVRDLDRARGFYEGLLGLETIPRPDFGVRGIWYSAGNTEVHLIEWPEGHAPEAPDDDAPISPLANHQAFGIGDYEITLSTLRDRGVRVLETSPEVGQMWIRDPDGNVIELIAARSR